MKTNIRILFLLVALAMSSCIGNRNRAPLSRAVRDVAPFTTINVEDGIDIYLTIAKHESIEVETHEDMLDLLATEVDDGILHVYFKRSRPWFSTARVYVTTPEVHKITASGGSDVKGENTIETDHLTIKASGGSDIYLTVQVNSLNIESSGGADIHLSGNAQRIEARTSGGSDLKAADLTVKEAVLQSSGGSDIRITVTEALTANASGGSDIYYKGNPEIIKANSSGGGDVKNIE